MTFFWCLLSATAIGVCFRLMAKWKVNDLVVIVINYTVCLALGLLLGREDTGNLFEIPSRPWFIFDLVLGGLFIGGFYLLSLSVKFRGITLPVLMQRMSLVVTVAFTVLIFHEKFGWLQALGLALGIGAILSFRNPGTPKKKDGKWIQLLALPGVLILSSAVEIILFYVEKTNRVGDDQMIFTTLAFGIAGAIGWLLIIIQLTRQNLTIQRRDILVGMVLGIPNFFSIYLVLMLLNKGWNGSVLYPMLNISILLLSTLIAILLFKEKLTAWNKIGVGLAILSIVMIAIAQN